MTGGSHTCSKVPEVTLGFWIIKILATTLGEIGALSATGSRTPEGWGTKVERSYSLAD